MLALKRTLRFTIFTLLEYGRSARILVELIAAMAFFYIFLRKTGQSIDAAYFFTTTGVFVPALVLFTMSSMIGLADRPQGYIVLARRLGRAGYLLGLFLSAVLIAAAVYGLICIATALLNPPLDLTLQGWLLSTPPLLLNVGLMAALVLMLSPLVFPTGWRLFVLGLIALAFSSNFMGGTLREQLREQFSVGYTLLMSVQTMLSWPLVPAFSGFALALRPDYSGSAPVIIIAQLSLLVALLGLSLYAFSRRDLVFNQQ